MLLIQALKIHETICKIGFCLFYIISSMLVLICSALQCFSRTRRHSFVPIDNSENEIFTWRDCPSSCFWEKVYDLDVGVLAGYNLSDTCVVNRH